MNAINIQNCIDKIKSADSYHAQKEYALDDETIEDVVGILEKVKSGELKIDICDSCEFKSTVGCHCHKASWREVTA